MRPLDTGQHREISQKQEEPILIEIEKEYDGVPVSIKGSARTEEKLILVALEENKEKTETNIIEGLDIITYDKKSILLMRHILVRILENELGKTEMPYKLSLSVSIFSSTRYLEALVSAVNDLLTYFSVDTKYYIEKDTQNNNGVQTRIRSSTGFLVYSMWLSPFAG